MELKTTSDLRKILTEDLLLLRDAKITKADARARAYVARNVIDTLKVELAAHAMNLKSFTPVLLESPERFITLAA